MRKTPLLFLTLVILVVACRQAGEKTGKSMTEFIGGMKGGVEKSLEVKIDLSDELKRSIELGEILLASDTSGADNKLSVYIIFKEDLNKQILMKSFVDDKENGRSTLTVKGKKGEAAYHEFIFDKRTNIDRQYAKLLME